MIINRKQNVVWRRVYGLDGHLGLITLDLNLNIQVELVSTGSVRAWCKCWFPFISCHRFYAERGEGKMDDFHVMYTLQKEQDAVT